MTADQSGKVRIRVLDSDPATQQFFYRCAKEKLKAAAYLRYGMRTRMQMPGLSVGWDADLDPRIQIHKKNSSKCKMQIIPDPDVVRIRESYRKQWECIRIQIPESGFRNFYADPRFKSDPYGTV